MKRKKESDPQHAMVERTTQFVISDKSNSLLLVQQEAELKKRN